MNTREHFRPVQLRYIVVVWTHHVEHFMGSLYGFEMPEGRLLWLLAQHGPSTATQLCGLAYMRKFQVSRSLAKLRDLGFVNMAQNPQDQRSEIVQLTDQGLAASETLLQLSVKWADLMEQDLTAGELKALDRALHKLRACAEQLGPVVEGDLTAARQRSAKAAARSGRSEKAGQAAKAIKATAPAAPESVAQKPARAPLATTPRRLHLR